MKKTLPFPVLTVNKAYYKCNLHAYNIGVHEMKDNQAYCYVQNETQASRGSQKVVPCLIKYFQLCCANKTDIVIFLDTCGGKNRNINVALGLMKYVQSPK